MSELENYLTVKEAAERLGMSEEDVRALCRTKRLAGATQAEKGQPWLIPAESIQQMINAPNSPPKPFWDKKWYIGLAAIVTILAGLAGLWADTGLREEVIAQFTTPSPTPTSTPLPTTTPLPTATPLPIAPEQEGETLIVISRFAVPSGNRDSLIHTNIQESINDKLKDLNLRNVRVGIESTVIDPEISTDEQIKAATELGEIYNASFIIWGLETDAIIEFNFLNLKEPDFDAAQVSIQDTANASLANPEAYGYFIIDDLPNQLSFLAFFSLGQSEYARSSFEGAIELIETAVAALPNLTEIGSASLELDAAYFRLAWLYQVIGQLPAAIAAYDQAIALNPELAIAFYNRGSAHDDLGEYEKAIENYDQAITINPEFAAAFSNRGNIYSYLGEMEKALIDFNKAISLNPNLATAYYNRGVIYANQGAYEEAIANFDQTILLDPEYIDAFYNRGVVYGAQGDYEQAIIEYQQAIALNPDLVEAYTNRGTAYFNQGMYDKAIADFGQAIALDPNETFAYYNRGVIYANQGDYEQAIADLNKAIALNPEFAEAYYNRGVVYGLQEEYGRALEEYNQALAFNPQYPEATYNRGVINQTLGNFEAAFLDFQQYVILEPQSNFAPAWNSICWLGSLLGNAENVADACDQAINLATDVHEKAIYLDSRGINKALRGDFEEAISDFQTFVDTFQNMPEFEIFVDKRISWINDLRANKNPFDAETLEELLNE